eukprot:1953587-Rhodomonas_salina.4
MAPQTQRTGAVALLLLFSASQLTLLADGFSLAPSALNLRSRLPSISLRSQRACGVNMVLSRENPEASTLPQKGGMFAPGNTEVDLQPTTKTSKPPVGVIDLLTKYAWGQQHPNIPLPIEVVEGQVRAYTVCNRAALPLERSFASCFHHDACLSCLCKDVSAFSTLACHAAATQSENRKATAILTTPCPLSPAHPLPYPASRRSRRTRSPRSTWTFCVR